MQTRGLASTDRDTFSSLLISGPGVVAAFIAAQIWVLLAAGAQFAQIYGDVTLYHWWANRGITASVWPVLHEVWVYPAGALVPIGLPVLFGGGWPTYAAIWTVMVIALNAWATWMLVRGGRPAPGSLATEPALPGATDLLRRRSYVAALWWCAFLAALGPIWLGRLEGVIAPMMLVALVLARRNPTLAVALATFGAWIKIAPGAIVAVLAASSRRLSDFALKVVAPGTVVSAIIIGLALAGGARSRALSVFGEQTGRTLQAESVAATWFSVARLWNDGVRIEFNQDIFTFEVAGTTARQVATVLDFALPIAVVLLALLVIVVARRRPDATKLDVVLYGTAATLLALIVFNKVGSPQFIAWIGPAFAAALALASPDERRRWLVPSLSLLGIAALTQVLYPMAYGAFIDGQSWMIAVAAVRNFGVVALLIWAITQLVRLAQGTQAHQKN